MIYSTLDIRWHVIVFLLMGKNYSTSLDWEIAFRVDLMKRRGKIDN